MLTAKDVFVKTLPFVWMKLLLGLAATAVCIALGALCLFFGWLFNGNGIVILVGYGVWIGGTEAVNFFLRHYLGYLVKAGHVAVVAQAMTTGQVPDDQINFGKNMVKERFAEANVYFALDKLVSGAVKQLGRTFGNVAHLLMLDRLPGFNKVEQLVKFYLDVALGYVDECCLGWSFLHKEQSPFKSAADGVVIYFQNWKELLKAAAKTVAIALVGVAAITLIVAVPLGILVKIFGIHGAGGFFAFVIAFSAARAVKNAFLDSWVMVSMMTKFLELAPNTELSVDLYGKLCGLSDRFKELFNKGQAESGAASASAGNAPGSAAEPPAPASPAA